MAHFISTAIRHGKNCCPSWKASKNNSVRVLPSTFTIWRRHVHLHIHMSISWIRIQVNGGTTLYRTSFFKHQTNSNVLFVGEPTFIIWPLAIFSHIEKVKAVLTTWFMTWMYRFFSTLKNAFRQQNTNRSASLSKRRRIVCFHQMHVLLPNIGITYFHFSQHKKGPFLHSMKVQ